MDVSLLQSYFDFFYAMEILEKMTDVVNAKCVGCVINSLSQMDHSCLALSKTDKLKLFFEDILLVVDENEILRNWEHSTSLLEVDEIAGLFRLKIYCRDWRDTDMKSLVWKSKMIRMTEQLLRLENKQEYQP